MLCVATPLAAQSASPVVLAPGEVLAQSVGAGEVHSRPDIARFRVKLAARGETISAARNACALALRDLTAKLAGVGVPAAAITILPPDTAQIGFIGNEAYADFEAAGPAGAAAMQDMARARKVATAGVLIELTDMRLLAPVRALLAGREDVAAQPAAFSLRDDAAPRRAAAAQAIAHAREEADAYAGALGLRVSRIVRVFNPAATFSGPDVMSPMRELMRWGVGGDEVITETRVGMDVVLAPR
jgi:hypothetical protein